MSRYKTILKSKAYWKSVIGLAIGFIVIYALIRIIFNGFDYSFLLETARENPIRFIVANIVSGVIYGIIVAYFQFNKKLKDLER